MPGRAPGGGVSCEVRRVLHLLPGPGGGLLYLWGAVLLHLHLLLRTSTVVESSCQAEASSAAAAHVVAEQLPRAAHAPNSGGRTPGSKLPASPPPLLRPNGGRPTLQATPEQRTKLSDTQGSRKNVQIPSATGSGTNEASSVRTSPCCEAAPRRAGREPTPKSELHLHEYTGNSSKSTNTDASHVSTVEPGIADEESTSGSEV